MEFAEVGVMNPNLSESICSPRRCFLQCSYAMSVLL